MFEIRIKTYLVKRDLDLDLATNVMFVLNCTLCWARNTIKEDFKKPACFAPVRRGIFLW